jgi:uncharacterized membrane protein
MSDKNSVIAMFYQHGQAEDAIRQLQRAGFDMKKLSIISKAYRTEENVVGYYTTGDRVKYWGANGAFWGGIWGLLTGSAFFVFPGVGPLLVAGALVAAVVESLGAALYSIGIPKQSVLQYETSIKAGSFMLAVHGTPEDVTRAQAILSTSGASDMQLHLAEAPAIA